jgi:hypothetical protein
MESKIKAIQDAIRAENELPAVEAKTAIQQPVTPTVLEWKRLDSQRAAVEKRGRGRFRYCLCR